MSESHTITGRETESYDRDFYDEFDDDDEWYRGASAIDSATESPTKSTPSLTNTPQTSRLSNHILSAFENLKAVDEYSPTNSPTRNIVANRAQSDTLGSQHTSKDKGKARAIDLNDGGCSLEDAEMHEVEDLIDTDTDTDSYPSTRPASLYFPESNETSMTSIFSDSPSRKRSWDDYPESLPPSVPPSPTVSPSPKLQKTTDSLTRKSQVSIPTLKFTSDKTASTQRSTIPFPPPKNVPSLFNPMPPPPTQAASGSSSQSILKAAEIRPPVRTPGKQMSLPVPTSVPRSLSSDEVSRPWDPVGIVPVPIIPLEDMSKPLSPELTAVTRMPFGKDLTPVLVAHSSLHQKILDERHIAWGVQFEIARGISNGRWKWEDVTPAKVDQLKGTSATAAPKVRAVMLSESIQSSKQSASDYAIWQELDREQKAIVDNKSRGLGLMGDWEGSSNWYGGRIQQRARLEVSSDGREPYVVRLQPLEMQRSNRVARYFGSRRLLQLSVSQELLDRRGDDVRSFINGKRFVICGRVFVPFHAKENGVYLIETSENFDRTADWMCGDQHRISFSEFISWHNPLELNFQQPISKWSTRWALALSNSMPVLEFKSHNIWYIEDIVAPHDPSEGKPPAEKIMTDGCGFMNGAALLLIKKELGLDVRPTAVQGRIAGSKGLWILHPVDRDPKEPPRIWIRDSQKKVKFPPLMDSRAHRIFDHVAPARVTAHRLSKQTIMNLSHNGVPDLALVHLMEQALDEEVKRLTDWDSPFSMPLLWKAIQQAGGVTGMRTQRLAGGISRAIGLAGREFRRNEDGEALVDESINDPSAIDDVITTAGRNMYSGAPLSVHESALELVQAGFHPLNSQFLYEKLHTVLKLEVESHIKEFRIGVPQSLEAFIVCDPFGVLEENQIYFHSSKSLQDPDTGVPFNIVEGEVLIGRLPIRVPSDIQKVRAVNCSALSEFQDVVVVPVKGAQSLASLLSGGDLDGDVVFLIWSPSLVSPFINQPFTEPPPDFIATNFDRKVVTVTDSLKAYSEASAFTSAAREFQEVLLLGLADSKVGLYSTFHDRSVYMHGLDDKQSIHYGYMFTTELDSSKTGLRIKPHVFQEDQKISMYRLPKCMERADSKDEQGGFIKRDRHLPPFILDTLLDAGERLKEKHLVAYDRLKDKLVRRRDEDLCQPFYDARDKAKLAADAGFPYFQNELQDIEDHVKAVYNFWTTTWADKKSPQKKGPSSQKKKEKRSFSGNEDRMGHVARRFAHGPANVVHTSCIDEVKASYAYYKYHKDGPDYFAFCVAFKDLTVIKARAKGQIGVTLSFSEHMTISAPQLRAMEAAREPVGVA